MFNSYSEVCEYISERGLEDVVIFGTDDASKDSYCTAFIGLSHDDRAVYDFNLMVEYCIKEMGMEDESEAIEWIEYNTIRAIPYYENGPIVLYRAEE